MSKLLYMPEVLANTTHAVISRWLVKEGDQIEVDQCIAEIETDKAVIDMLAEEVATISKLIASEGEEVAVGAPIAQLNGDGVLDETLIRKSVDIQSNQEDRFLEKEINLVEERDQDESKESIKNRIFASPLARRLAKNNHIDLANIIGTGPNGRIIKRDINKVVNNTKERSVNSDRNEEKEFYDVIPLSNMRKTIARRLSESKQTVPHFYLTMDCKVEDLVLLRKNINEISSTKVSVNDLIVKAVGLAMKDVPEINASFEMDKIHQYHHSDISIAVATENGIQTPIIRKVEEKPLIQIHEEINELIVLAKESRLLPKQYQGGGFSISNLGMYGIDSFNAIINPPQAGILAVGTIRKVPTIVNGNLEESSVMSCTLSVDHRVVDGAKASEWLAAFKARIEAPLSLLL